jgi:hypothetical protein
MRKYLKNVLFLATASFCFSLPSKAQYYESPSQYMEFIGKANEKISSLYLSYLSAVGHNKSARKVDKRRQEVVTTIFNTRFEIQGMPPWKGDRTYRDTTVAYMKLLNMEEIAEQSYDAMEAYMLAQEKANEKLVAAVERQQRTQKAFADKYGITLVNTITDLDVKSKQASQLMDHYGDAYLLFFKAFKQEAYIMDAIAKKNITSLEQNKSSMQRFAEEGLHKLTGMNGYNNDPALLTACKNALTFYKEEADRFQFATDLLLKEEAFAKMKKTFESKPASQRSQKEVDDFNKSVKDINAAINEYNFKNNQLNKERDKALDQWNNAVKKYLDEHMPYQRKG